MLSRLLFPLLLTMTASGIQAQTTPLVDGAANGVTLDRFIYDDVGVNVVSFRHSGQRSGAVGTELGVSLFPQALGAGALLLAPDIGPSFSLPVGNAALLLKAGGSAFVALGGGIAVLPGFHLGGGLIIPAERRFAIRLDLTRRFYLVEGMREGIWSVGLGFMVLPRDADDVF
jgi:hypothetical protein